jgi:hypothetical protein
MVVRRLGNGDFELFTHKRLTSLRFSGFGPRAELDDSVNLRGPKSAATAS